MTAEHDDDYASQVDEDDSPDLGAEGGDESPSADRAPAAPADDDAPLGDTDQHSRAYGGEDE